MDACTGSREYGACAVDNFAQTHANLTNFIPTESWIHDDQFDVHYMDGFEELEKQAILRRLT